MANENGLGCWISRKMNAINKTGRPIIPLRSSDESFSSDRAKKTYTIQGKSKRKQNETKKNGTAKKKKKVTLGKYVIRNFQSEEDR